MTANRRRLLPISRSRRVWVALRPAAARAVPLAAACFVLALTLLGLVLPLTGASTPGVMPGTSDGGALGLGLVPVVVGLVVVGSSLGLVTVAVASIAVAAHHGRRQGAWSAADVALAVLPRAAVVLAVGVALALAAVPLGPVVAVAAVAWAVRSWRRGGTRRAVLGRATLAVPGVVPVLVLGVVVGTVGNLVGGHRVRPAVVAAARATKERPVPPSVGLAAWLGVGILTGAVGERVLTGSTQPTATVAAAPAGGSLLALSLLVVAWTALSGILLGVSAAPLTLPPVDGPRGDGRIGALSGRRFWRAPRLRRVSTVVTMALLVQAAMGLSTLTATATADEDQAPVDSRQVFVTTSEDTGAVVAGACEEPDAPCDLRSAVAVADERLRAGSVGSVEVSFAVAATITLAAPLRVTAGTTLTGGGLEVVLDAARSGRALELVGLPPSEEEGPSPSVTLDRLTVTGGRTSTAGAAVRSTDVGLRLSDVVVRDNVATSGDGGAVSAPSVLVTTSTFIDNRASAGQGGAVAAARVAWENSTSVRDAGATTGTRGGSVSGTTVNVTHGTFVSGGGLYGRDLLRVANSLVEVAGEATACESDDEVIGVGNVDLRGDCQGTTGSAQPLGDLGDNGGSTPTVALLEGSAALGAADPAFCPEHDQRGVRRDPADCDAGAFESSRPAAPTATVLVLADAVRAVTVGEDLPVIVVVSSASEEVRGTVDVLDGDTVVADDVPVDAGEARVTLRPTTTGRHPLTATYTPSSGGPVATSPVVDKLVKVESRIRIDAPGDVAVGQPARFVLSVEPSPSPGVVLDPAPVATGELSVRLGDESTVLAVVDGTATWDVPTVRGTTIEVVYPGDDSFYYTSADKVVVDRAVATTTTVSAPRTVDHGREVPVTTTITTRPGAVPATGFLDVFVDGTEVLTLVTGPDGRATRPLSGLAIGAHEVVVRFRGSAGFTASTSAPVTVTVVPASTSVSLDAPSTLSTFDRLDATATVAGSGPATVRLLDGDRVLASQDVTLSQRPTTVVLPRSERLLAGRHDLVAEVSATPTTRAARSPVSTLLVTRPGTRLGVTTRVATPGTFGALDVTAPDEASGVLVLRDASGRTLAEGRLAQGRGTLTWTAARPGPTSLTVTFAPDSASPWGDGSLVTEVDVPRLPAPTPVLRWSDSPHPGRTTLAVDFSAWGGLGPLMGGLDSVLDRRAPTGTVRLVRAGGELASGTLVDGRVEVRVGLGFGPCPCTTGTVDLSGIDVVWAGDEWYLPSRTRAPAAVITPWPSTTSVTVPTAVAFNDVLRLSATVTSEGTEAGYGPHGTVVFAVDGVDLPAVDVGVGGRAVTATKPGSWGRDVTVTARFVPATGNLLASDAAPAVATLAAAAAPRVQLSSLGVPAVGAPLSVTAEVRSDLDRVPDGTVLVLRAQDDGRELGRTTFVGGRATASVVPGRGGPLRLVGYFPFAPGGDTGQTTALDLDVPGLGTTLDVRARTLSGGVATVGSQLEVTVTPRLTEEQWARARSFTVVLRTGGEVVGAPLRLSRDQRSVTVRYRADVRGPARFVATTEGDGAELGRGAAASEEISVRGYDVSLGLRGTETVERGAPWTPDIDLRSLGGPEPTGTVQVSLTAVRDDQVVAGCGVVLALRLSCTVPGLLEPGSYDVTLDYSGDARHEPARGRGILVVRSVLSDLTTTYDPVAGFAPYRPWLVGQSVTARWEVTGRRTDGTVTVGGTLGTLCSAPASDRRCTFTVPDRGPRGGDALVVSTFEPASAGTTPSTHVTPVPAPAHCLPVAASVRYLDSFVADRGDPGAPAVTGSTCRLPQGGTGYVEDTRVTLDSSTVLGSRYEGRYSVVGVQATDAGGAPVVTGDLVEGRLGVRVGAVAALTVLVAWTPRCVQLRASDQAAVVGGNIDGAGGIRFLTSPNCADPLQPTDQELEDAATGVLRVAAGTPVRVTGIAPRQKLPDGTRVPYVLREIRQTPGAAPAPLPSSVDGSALADDGTPRPAYWTTTPREDTTVWPRYDVSPGLCMPTSLLAGEGGSLDEGAATLLPIDAYRIATDSAVCRDFQDRQGYLPGTVLSARATPVRDRARNRLLSSQYFVVSFAEAAGTDVGTGLGPSGAVSGGIDPGAPAYEPRSQDFTVPAPPVAERGEATNYLVQPYRVGVRFGHVVCGALRVNVEYLPRAPRTEYDARYAQAPSNCPAWQDVAGGEGRTFYRAGPDASRQGLSIPGSLRATIERSMGFVTEADGSRRRSTTTQGFDLQVRGLVSQDDETVDTFQARRSEQYYGGTGPQFGSRVVEDKQLEQYFTLEPDGVTQVDLAYFDVNCRPSDTAYDVEPRGFAVATAGSTWCPPGEISARSGGAELTLSNPLAIGTVPSLTAPGHTLADANDGQLEPTPARRAGSSDQTLRIGGETFSKVVVPLAADWPVQVDFCQPVQLRAQVLDPDDGVLRDFELPRRTFETGDTCPDADQAHLGYTVPVGMTAESTLGLEPVRGPSTATMGPYGGTEATEPFVLRVRCATLTVGNAVDMDTAPTCPYAGGGTREGSYLRGSQVQLSFDRENDRRFESWIGVDASEGESAGVLMLESRTVSVDYHSLNVGEQIGSVLGNVLQRAVGVVLTALTGIFLGVIAAVSASVVLLKGVSIGLRALGVKGYGVDLLEAAGELGQAQLDMVGAVATCTTAWSTGGSARASLTKYGDGAAAAVPVLVGLKDKEAAPELTKKGNVVALLINTGLSLAANPDDYLTSDQASKWSRAPAEIGGCIRDKANNMQQVMVGKGGK